MSTLATPAATLVARHLHYEHGGRVVLEDLSLTVSPATCLGVVGPNGVGKSTLLQILAGLIDPAAQATSASIRRWRRSAIGPRARRDDGRDRAHDAGTPSGDHRSRSRSRRGGGGTLAEGAPGADDRYAAALARFESVSAGDFESRLSNTLAQVGLSPDLLATSLSSRSRAVRRRAPRWPPSFSRASTSSCSMSRRTTSTSMGCPGSRRWSSAGAAAW